MTNKDIVTNWKTLGVLLEGEKEPQKLVEHFMLCWGEVQQPIELEDGKKVSVVIFDTGGEQGSPSLWCHSDEQDNCWELYFDPKDEKSKEKVIGKFVKLGD
jgi:hypothetical protein